MVTAWYMTMLVASGIPWSRIWHLSFAKKKQRRQYFNWNSYQSWSKAPSNTYKKYWLVPIFFSPGDSHTKGSLVLLFLALGGITEVGTDPKEEFVSFKVTPLPLMTEFSVFIALQSIAPASSWIGDVSLKDSKIIWKIKMREMKTK